jgi:rhodanese-related sulfurtransferase/predicted transcriptional regulator
MSNQGKRKLYGELSRIGKALASANRLELLEILAQGERTVELLSREADLSISNASQHLKVLREARLVESRKDGLFVYYRLVAPEVFELVQSMRQLAEQHMAEVERLVRSYFRNRDELEPISREELVRRAKDGMVIVLDVRPVEEYRAGHIPGAISVPVDELAERLAEIPRGREVVAYCRGPYCLMAHTAVDKLHARGRRARRLIEGFPEWRAAGLPVDAVAEEVSR